MTWTLFLDDERAPTWDLYPCEIARDCAEAIELIQDLGLPNIISFDHDLGKDVPSAMTLMRHLVDGHLDGLFDCNLIERIVIHSANPVGAKNLAGLWDGFAGAELTTDVRAELRPRTSNHK